MRPSLEAAFSWCNQSRFPPGLPSHCFPEFPCPGILGDFGSFWAIPCLIRVCFPPSQAPKTDLFVTDYVPLSLLKICQGRAGGRLPISVPLPFSAPYWPKRLLHLTLEVQIPTQKMMMKTFRGLFSPASKQAKKERQKERKEEGLKYSYCFNLNLKHR